MNLAVLNWSSGKDAALAYWYLLQDTDVKVESLLTTIGEETGRIVMHGIREELLERQADAMGLPLARVKLPASPDNAAYESCMAGALDRLKEAGISHAAFGDIFLEDLRAYREQKLKHAGFNAIFPLWQKNNRELILQVEHTGIEA
ncbi:MAG: ATP-binding protein, partial [Sphingobacteriales bacterium]